MSQNKKKFFGKHKDEQEQDLEQTQPLPPMPENNSDKTVQTEEKTRRQSSLLNPFAKDLIKVNASALSSQPD